MPRVSRNRRLELLAIGTAAGVFSGLFGVGGRHGHGPAADPVARLRRAHGHRDLARGHHRDLGHRGDDPGVYGNLHVDDGLLVGIPAVGGVLLGTWLQQRVSMRVISVLFALLLTALAVELVLA